MLVGGIRPGGGLLELSFAGYVPLVSQNPYPIEEDIGGYPIPQYRKKNWQIPKYRVENRPNTDTAFMIGHAYLTLYPSRIDWYNDQNTK